VSRDRSDVAVVTGLDVDALDISAKGGAIVTLSGRATAVKLTADGGSTANLADLAAMTVNVGIDGAATATLTAGDLVTGRASGGAQVSVSGDALVTVNADGGTRVVRRQGSGPCEARASAPANVKKGGASGGRLRQEPRRPDRRSWSTSDPP
jgi:hypothetical protein